MLAMLELIVPGALKAARERGLCIGREPLLFRGLLVQPEEEEEEEEKEEEEEEGLLTSNE